VWLLLQEPHGVTNQKTPFFIVTAVKTSNLTDNTKMDLLEIGVSVVDWIGLVQDRYR
jgi:hypothetical protein